MDTIIFYGVLFILALFGVVATVKPDFIWKIDHFFTVKNGEPTNFYLRISRFGGIFILVLCIVIFIASFIYDLL